MNLSCLVDPRRDAVRAAAGRNGLDYVEVADDPPTLHVYFLGKLPRQLAADHPDLKRHFVIEGGDAITDLVVIDADPVVDPDPERDDCVVLRLDRVGDRSRYILRLVDVEGIDPHYADAGFSFRIDCASDVDCRPKCECEPPAPPEPSLNYLAKDYASFRQLILDRLAVIMPEWRERHVPDLGITLVELLAYVGDYLSYQQDAVATEAYLATARQRISVRRHARLIDYRLHEGCNARAWVHVGVDSDTPPLTASQLAFLTPFRPGMSEADRLLRPEQLEGVPASAYEWYEPLVADPAQPLVFRARHSRIVFYSWGRRSCCLAEGSVRATLLDAWREDGSRALDLKVGDVLVFEEVLGPKTGLAADADPTHRWAVRLTRVERAEDPLYPVSIGEGEHPQTRPTPVVEIEWAAEDALPFALCLSSIGLSPECKYITDVSVARGNIVLVDHGRTFAEPLGPVPSTVTEACCECEGQAADVMVRAARFRPTLGRSPVAHAEPLQRPPSPASVTLRQDPQNALPLVSIEDGVNDWAARADLLDSGPDDRDFVVEIDNEGTAHLRFGDGELGRSPDAASSLHARYRRGGGTAGNVGAEAISCLLIQGLTLDGVAFTVRNPLAAQGGTDPEPIEQAKLLAPLAFRRLLRRAITAEDYAAIAAQNPSLQSAHAALVWTGSWYEADVAIDPWRRDADDPAIFGQVEAALFRVRRMGHDVHVRPAMYVPIVLTLRVCARPGYDRGHIKAALAARFIGSGDAMFAPDRLVFGQDLHLSRIVAAAMAVQGVERVAVVEFRRYGSPPAYEIDNGVLALAPNEIALLANDPDHPDRGTLTIEVTGGR